MVGILVVVVVSWALLWLFFRAHITALGIVPTGRRLKEFAVGLVFMALCCTINQLGQAWFTETSYALNPHYDIWGALDGTWWTFKAALFEELVFRGAILLILIRKIGAIWGCVIGAAAFGIYHWFSYGVLGSVVPMVYVFLVTGAGGWMFAYAFAKTKSLYAPLGLHFGWIVMSIVVFSDGPMGTQLLIANEGIALGGWPTLLFFLWQTMVVPGLVTWYLAKRYVGVKEG